MAESVVTFFLQNLGDLATQEARFLNGVQDQVRLLNDELQWIRFLLRDADEKRRQNKMVNFWVSQIRDVAYDAEDAIETFLLKVERQHLSRSSIRRLIGPLGRYVSYIIKLPTIHRLGDQIEEINTRLERISNNKSKYGIDYIQAEEYSASSSTNEIVPWKVNRAQDIAENEDVVGFKKEEEELAKKLIEQGDHHQFGVVSIVGMGGLGKTTLAKKIFDRNDIKNHFDCHAFIYVSQEFTIHNLLHSTVKQIMELSEEKTVEELRKMLIDHLKERTCLIVMDDVWKKEDWDRLKHLMLAPLEGKQSRVLLTTRNEEVATHANPSIYRHNLRLLDERESWDLFVKVVFRGGSMETNLSGDLKSVGEKIVAKCGRLPLAIVVLGGLLFTKEKTIGVWNKVLHSATWQLSHGSNQCLQVLALSYNDLPYYLKSCFLYFGLFPEDAKIKASQLIRMWVAEGFIEKRDNELKEDVGEDYLEELIQRSMIQVEKRRFDGRVKTCRIHDMLREMAISEAKKDKFFDIHDGNFNLESPNRTRRLAIHDNNSLHNSNASFSLQHSDLNHLRSLLSFSIGGIKKDLWKDLCRSIKLLRVLNLERTWSLRRLPDEIGQLIFLKYLGLQETGIRILPHSVGNLRNLQTLDLWNNAIWEIPSVIWKLQKLRHLQLFRVSSWYWKVKIGILCNDFVMGELSCCRPRRIERLKDLQTLGLPAGSWIENGLLHKLANLRELKIIRGKSLHIYREALSVSIRELVCLRVLWLVMATSAFLPLVSFSDHVHLYDLRLEGKIEKLVDFPPYLTRLQLSNSELKQDQDSPIMAVFEKLPKLRILELYTNSFVGTEMTCSDRGFPQLQELRLYGLENLEDWILEKGAMPNLRLLSIGDCQKLKMLPDGLRHITTLHTLKLVDMPTVFEARVDKASGGEDWVKIQHVINLIIQ